MGYPYRRPRSMHICPGCSGQVPYGYSCTSCYTPWDPIAFLVAEEIMEAEMMGIGDTVIVEEYVEVIDDGYPVEESYYDGGYDDGGGGW